LVNEVGISLENGGRRLRRRPPFSATTQINSEGNASAIAAKERPLQLTYNSRGKAYAGFFIYSSFLFD